MTNPIFSLLIVGLCVGLFLGILFFMEVGRRLGLDQVRKHGTAPTSGVTVIDGAVFGLLSLLLGFTFSGAASRFEKRRDLIIHEVTAVATAWKRLDALPLEPQPAIRADFRRYVDALIALHANPPSSEEERRERAALARAQSDVWGKAVAACIAPGGEQARMLVLPALGDMFGVANTARILQKVHLPIAIFVMLGVTVLAAALFGGYGMANASARNWLHMIGAAATITIAVYVILELESPRLGMIRVDALSQPLVELRATMKSPDAPFE